MEYNYIKIMNGFWSDVPYRDGYKPVFGLTFLAVVDLCNRNDWQTTRAEYDRMINRIGCSKTLYYQGLNWLKNQELIHYEAGRNDYAPARFGIGIGVQKWTSALPQVVPLQDLSLTAGSTSALPIIDKPLNLKTNKVMKIKKSVLEKLIFPPFASEVFLSVWAQLLKQPKWRKKTTDALQLSLSKLSKFNEAFAVEIMERAIENNYQGVVFSDTQQHYQEFISRPADNRPSAQTLVPSITYADMLATPATPQSFTPLFKTHFTAES